jgi:prevent-host-death family protein
MKTVTFSQLRNNAKKYFDDVEKGETVEVYRHGKPIAILSPAQEKPRLERWKTAKPLYVQGVSLSHVVLNERKKSRF